MQGANQVLQLTEKQQNLLTQIIRSALKEQNKNHTGTVLMISSLLLEELGINIANTKKNYLNIKELMSS